MASIFKRGGKRNRHGHYQTSYFDENGKRLTVTAGTSDMDAAREIAAKIEADVARRKRGVITADEARFAEHNARPLAGHIDDYLEYCEKHERQNAVHVANKRTQLTKLAAGTKATRLPDLDPSKAQGCLTA